MSSRKTPENECMQGFSPLIRDWFLENIGAPSEPQRRGWPKIASGRNVLICSPTGSGKTLAAFLKCLDWIISEKTSSGKKQDERNRGIRIIYISPLKALNNDIYRNLELPLSGLKKKASEQGMEMPEIKISVRTGDTPQKERTRMLKDPPDILITTPESLFIMLTSDSYRKLFSTTEYIIVDEIHSICPTKRGVHLSLSIERVERIAGKPLKRIGLTATINPLEEAARFLSGGRNVTVINCERKRPLELSLSLPVKDLKVLPENTVWPSIYAELLALVRAHRSTLIFVNNRRVAEMVAAGMNSLAGEPFVRTHHGSVSREIRHELERQLKEGEIPCLVATSSLELGIDIGSIDLVVQVSSPGTASQVLQRIGRSGHRIGAVSKGVIIPKTRGDLLDSAFISYQAKRYDIENFRVPQNCLDILAQQIVSIACEGEQDKDGIYEMMRKAYPYRDLPRKQFEDVIIMLSDPSPEDAPGSVKPRIMYDRGSGMVRGTPLGRRMCLMDGGTIPDKGNYNVYLMDTGTKVGELQEEFVFESRIGDRFFLGSSVWKIEKIEKDRVLVSHSNASGAKIPFWIGDKTLRSYETGKKLGQFLQRLEKEYDTEGFFSFMSEECGLDRTAAENLKTYIEDQLAATRHLPGADRIVCEHFSDETGDRRIVIHTPFGSRIHAPLAVILSSKLSRLLNCRMEYIYNDNGILFHIFGYTGKLSNIFSLLDKNTMEDEIFELLPKDYMFNINLRYNLIRSLLVEMKTYGKRTPLWIQRLRCAETAEHILGEPDHPAVVETYRECMNDIFDIRGLYDLVDKISAGMIKVTDVYTEKPSPFTSELLFNFWQIYQYSYELPVAERRNQLLVNDRDFIQLAAGQNAEYELLDPRAIKAVEKEMEKYKYGRTIKNADDLWYYLYSYGELRAEPYSVTAFKGSAAEDLDVYLEQLESQRRIIRINIGPGNGIYWVAAEDFPLYFIAAGRDPENETVKVGKPGGEKEVKAVNLLSSYVFDLAPGVRDAAVRLIRRHVMFSGPFRISDLTQKYGMDAETADDALKALVSGGEVLKIKESDDPDECIYCHKKVYERIKQRTIKFARKDIKPKAPEIYCSYLLNKHLVTDRVLSPDEKLPEVLKTLNGQYFPASWWEDFILPSRINGYNPKMLDYLCATGQVRWRGRLSKNTKETAFFMTGEEDMRQDRFAEPDDLIHDPGSYEKPNDFTMDETEAGILEVLDKEGAVFLNDLSKRLKLPPSDLLAKMERLVWCGIITNDSFSVIRYYIDNEKKNSPWTKYNTYPSMGRWSKTSGYGDNEAVGSIAGYVNILLDRYGIVSKEIVNKEKYGFNWTETYTWLKNNELASGIKRGYYISGLSGIQFMRDRDIELIRMMDTPSDTQEYVALCSCDPANPYRDILTGSVGSRVAARQSNAVVFCNGKPVLYIREYGHTIQQATDDTGVLKDAASCFVETYRNRMLWTGKKNIFTEYWSDLSGNECFRIEDSPIYDALLDLGYERGYSGITLWRKAL